MCVLQCRCGMVISTPADRARCIRCGAVLSSADRLPAEATGAAESVAGGSAEKPTSEDEETGRAGEGTDDHQRRQQGSQQHVLATYVTLVIIAAARVCGERVDVR